MTPDTALTLSWVLLGVSFAIAMVTAAVVLRNIDRDEDRRAAQRRRKASR